MITGLVGPTCVGKTAVSIALAKALSAEIVSVDSRQIYRELSICTAKPSDEELAAVPHHFISERSLRQPITAAEFAGEARRRVFEIESRGKNGLLVGGSTLYLHAMLFGLDDVPPSDPDVRGHLKSRLESDGLSALTAELAEKDPVSYDRMDRSNPRRVLRALEVYQTTGKPLSSFQTGSAGVDLNVRVVVLDRDRKDLYRRIARRTDAMVTAGLADEVKVLLDAGFDFSLQALQTIGYKETLEFLRGNVSERELVDLIARNTRRYAKRQLTWFRRYEAFEWVHLDEHDDVKSICNRLLDMISL